LSSTTETAKAEPKPALLRLAPLLTVCAAVVVLGSRFFLVIAKHSVNFFWWDQWDYLGAFFRGNPGIVELFTWQHGPHREGVGLLLDKFLFPLTRWNTRVDAFVIGVCVFAAMVLALMLKHKLFGTISYCDVAIPALFFTLAQCEKIVADPNPAYAGFPLLLIMLYCHALLQRNLLLRYLLVLALNFLLIYTGFGVFMGPVTIGVFILECTRSIRRVSDVSWPLPFAALIISALSLASFFVHYKFWPAVNCFRFPYHPLWHYPWFVAIMFSRFVIGAKGIALATLVGIPIAAIVVVLAAVYFWRVLRHKAGVEAMIQFVLLTYTLLFSVDCAIGRVCLGLPEAAQAARYVSLMIPAFLALYFWLFRLKLGSKRTITLTAFAVISLVASSNRPALLHWYTQTKTTWAACFLQTQNVQACDQLVGISIYPSDGVGAATFQQKLEFLKDHHLSFFAGAAESDRKQ